MKVKDFFLGFFCNYLSCFTTVKITFSSVPLLCFIIPGKSSSLSSPSTQAPAIILNGYSDSSNLNGHSPLNKRPLDASLDDLVHEIESYDAEQTQPEPSAEPLQPKEGEVVVEETPVAVDAEDAMATLEILESEADQHAEEVAGPAVAQWSGDDKVDNEEPSTSADYEACIVVEEREERPSYAEEKETEEEEEKKEEEKEKKEEGKEEEEEEEEEEKKEEEKEKKEGEKKEEEEERKKEQEEEKRKKEEEEELKAFEVKPERKSKLRNSFLKLKRKPQSVSAADKKETGKKGELAGSDPCLAVDGEKEPKPEGEEKEEGKDKFEEKPTTSQAEEPKPKLRSRFKVRRRPRSMGAADRKGSDDGNGFSRDDHTRHSYHAGDLPEPSNLRKFLKVEL